MNTERLILAPNIQGALTGYGLDMLDAFMSEPAELASLTPARAIIQPGDYLNALATYSAPKRLPEPKEESTDEWDF